MRETGKYAKGLCMPLRDERRLDPKPAPAKIPGKPGGRKLKNKRKRYGFTYEFRHLWERDWKECKCWAWYHTTSQRDDEMRNFPKRFATIMQVRNMQPCDRLSPSAGKVQP